jgi:hypothetical protein
MSQFLNYSCSCSYLIDLDYFFRATIDDLCASQEQHNQYRHKQ